MPITNATLATGGPGAMNATGNAIAATAATAISHLSCWRRMTSPRRYLMTTARSAEPKQTADDQFANPPSRPVTPSRAGTWKGFGSSPDPSGDGPRSCDTVDAASAPTARTTTQRHAGESRRPSGKISGISTRTTTIGSVNPSSFAITPTARSSGATPPARWPMTAQVPMAIVVVWSAADHRIIGPIGLSGTRTVRSAPTTVNATAMDENMSVKVGAAAPAG